MEKLMHYVWQHKLWLPDDMKTVDGRRVWVIDPGLHNNDAGPDFFNATVIIDGQTWCGNVEIHVRASDWNRHGHQNDKAYDSVVLHVVSVDDARITRSDGQEIPQLCMPCAADFRERYLAMVDRPEYPACRNELTKVSRLYVTDWLSSLGYERLYQKVERVMALNQRLGGDWAETVYVTLARGLGFSTNSDPFERVALSVPLHCLLKHRDSSEAVEGALFGQAGFLDNAEDDSHYVGRMKQEFEFMTGKFNLKRPDALGWRMSRMRPQNFPHRRIATLAAMICKGFRIGSDIFSVETEDDARRLFDFDLTGYWARRYNFKSDNAPSVKALSRDSVTVLIINVVVPILYAYGISFDDGTRREKAIALLQSLQPESNTLVRSFVSAGVACDDAFTSQALIQLRRAYCEQRKCLYCRIGHILLASKVRP